MSDRIEALGALRMRFSVLGPFAVTDDAGAAIAIRSGMQRRLLAILLTAPGRTATVDRLVDELWDGRPPAAPENNLQVHIHRLRRVLGEDRITYQPPGYALRVGSGEVDSDQFEQLAGLGRTAIAQLDHRAAGEALGAALELWRGTPYPEFDGTESVRRETSRLTELRLGVLEDRVEADLGRGLHIELVPELTDLVRQHPLRERLLSQQMLALYRCGRGAEALSAFRDARHTLVDELGLDPGVELRRLEQAILSQDPELDLALVDDAEHATTRPAELPAGTTRFTGREEELVLLTDRLRSRTDDSQLVAVSGPGGVGKSTLALEAANAVADAFPNGQLYVNLHGADAGLAPLSGYDAVARCLRSLGVDDPQIPDAVEEAAARFRSTIAGKRLLIVLDDAADPAQVRPLLPGRGSPAAVLVTSRPILAALDPTTEVRLGAFSPSEARDLLARQIGVDRVAAEPDATDKIVGLCEGLPLALRIAGARLSGRPDRTLDWFARRLGDAHARLDELEHGDLAVRASCAVGYEALDAPVARTFTLLGDVGLSDFTPPVVEALADLPERVVQQQLDQLVEAQLLRPGHGDRYELHDLLRLYAVEQAALLAPADRTAATTRLVHHVLATTRQASRALNPASERRCTIGLRDADLSRTGEAFSSGADAAQWVVAEADNLLAAMHHAHLLLDDGPTVAIALAAALAVPLASQGDWNRLLAANQTALRYADQLPDPVGGTIMARRDLAATNLELQRYDETLRIAEPLLADCRAHGEHTSESVVLNLVGTLRSEQGRPDLAIECYQRSLELERARGDLRGEVATLNNLGDAYVKLGRQEDGKRVWERCVEIHEELGDSDSLAIVLSNLGQSHARQNDHARALDYYLRSRDLNRSLGFTHAAMKDSWDAADALNALGRTTEARSYRLEALEYLQSTGALAADDVRRMLEEPQPKRPPELATN
ncbi:BTAD domain-containing putative transcriptional regulator [Kribbella sp. NPDC054772]